MLQPGEALTAIKSTLALVWGLAAILLITPLMAFAVLKLPLQPPAMALGLAIYCCMPTSLSTNIALTQVSRVRCQRGPLFILPCLRCRLTNICNIHLSVASVSGSHRLAC